MHLTRRPHALLASSLAVAALAVAGCGSDDDGGGGAGGGEAGSVKVVATTTVLGDVARAVGGEAVDVTQLLQPNSDPHDYEPRPQDVVETSKAAVVFASGDGLDDWAGEVVEQSAGNVELVDVAARLPVRRENAEDEHGHGHAEEPAHEEEAHAGEDEHGHGEDEHGHEDEPAAARDEHAHEDEPAAADDHAAEEEHTVGDGHDHGPVDPHWWHDPTNVEAAVAVVRDELTRQNPDGRALYARNADAYLEKLHALDAGIRRCLAAVPAAQRKLVTDHDALGYFADRYDVEVIGAVIPSLSTQAQPSAGDVAELARVIRREGVRAVFPESGSSRKLPEAVAKETGVTAEYELYGDTLGPEGSDAATYLGMEAHNADAMVRGFTGGARGCEIPGL